MKKEIFKSHWKMYTAYTGGALLVTGLIGFYFFFYAPQARVKAIVNDTNSTYEQSKEDTSYMNSAVADWETYVEGDLSEKITKLTGIQDNFAQLKSELESLSVGSETQEIYNIMHEYAEKGKNAANNMAVVSEYFKKVEAAVSAFNGLNTDTSDLDSLKKLVLDFKSVSEDSLAELELLEAPTELLEIDKDYKDLLRQYIESAENLSKAIESNDTNEVEKVGNTADEDVALIVRQLTEDLDNFSQNSSVAKDLEILMGLRSQADDKINTLKNNYGI